MPTTASLRAAYDAQQRHVVTWLAALPGDAWMRPSALEAWSVRDLAFHISEVPGSLTRAVHGGAVRDQPLSIAEYTAAWRPAAAEIAERDRSAAAQTGPAEVLVRHGQEHAALTAALDSIRADAVVRARRGPISVSDFLLTRVNELVVHSLDLSLSLPDIPDVPLDRGALGASVRMLLDILVVRAPGKSVEVRIAPYAAEQCGSGPRHTRGTPPNVVEADARTWVAVATGRRRWADAVTSGDVRASGGRSDLSAYLPVLS